jgi:GTP-binding protein
VLVIDATEPVTAQDAHIAGYAWDAGKGLVVVVNKWDLVVPKDDRSVAEYTKKIQRQLHFVHDAPIVFTSALTRQRVRRILDLALEVKDVRGVRVPTAELNRVIQEALQTHQPASHSGKLLRLRYATQVAVDPPTFVFFVNDPQIVHFSYQRFLENQLRERFKLTGTALRIYFRSSREAPGEAAGSAHGGGRRAPAAPSRRTGQSSGKTGNARSPRAAGSRAAAGAKRSPSGK